MKTITKQKSAIQRNFFLMLALLIVLPSFSQTTVVRGKVTAFNEFTLQNITIKAKSTKTQTKTDSNGCFQLVCAEKDLIIFESPAFVTIKKRVKAPVDSLNVNMVFIDTPKKREYAIGYGVMSKENLTYAIENLSNENNNFNNYSNIYDLIIGRFAGVEVRNNEIIIRGESSLTGSNAALLVVDGAVVSDISFIPPAQVKSIDVLKGAAAGVYGSRGANGVVIITLKTK